MCRRLFLWEDAIWLPDLSAFTLAGAAGTRPHGSAPDQGLPAHGSSRGFVESELVSGCPWEGGAFVSRQNTLDTAHRAQALFTSVPAVRKVASFPRRAQKKGLGANALGAGGIPLSCGSPQPRRAVKTPLLGCPGCRGALATCSPPLPSPCWQGTAGPSEQLRNNCCFSSPVNLARRSRFDQCTWIPAFSLDQGRRRDGRERALAGSLGTAWEAELLLQEKPASK